MLCEFLVYSKVIQFYICVYVFFVITIFHFSIFFSIMVCY